MVDLRSGGYAAAWTPRHATVVGVRGFTEQDGARKVISHFVKAIRGDVARALLQAPEPARTPRTSPRSRRRRARRRADGASVDVIATG